MIRPRLSHAADLEINEPGIDLAQRAIAECPTLHLSGTVVFAQDGGLGDQAFEQVASLRQAHIKCNAILAGINIVE